MLVPEEHFLFQLEKRKKLAKILHTNIHNFKNIEEAYNVTSFPKVTNSKTRNLYNTDKQYKALLRRLNRLFHRLNIPDYVYAGVPKRDFLDNAAAHHKRPYIQSADIKSFFPNTKDSYVYGFFKNQCQTSPDVSKILTLLTTYKKNDQDSRHIPQGFPTSTLLSFLAYFDLFNGINQLCQKNNIHFTLFVDDMTFSSYKKIPKSFLKHIDSIVRKYDLFLHPDKIERYTKLQPKQITGVIIDPLTNEFKTPNKLQKKIHDNLTFVHNSKITSLSEYIKWKKVLLTLEGQVNHLKRIEPNRQLPYISKVIVDAKNNFLTPSVKGVPQKLLNKEYLAYIE